MQMSKMHEKPGLPSSQEFKASITPNDQLTENNIWHISQYLAIPKWSHVGQELGMPITQLEDNKHRNQHSYRDCASRMLLDWREANPSCTVQDLFKALKELNMMSTIKEIEKYLGI